MIRNEREYKEARERLAKAWKNVEEARARLESAGLPAEQIEKALEPVRTFHLQLAEEVETYEGLKRGDIRPIMDLRNLGYSLVALRIARNISQVELARRLNISESQVSRDERNDYHGITVERAQRIIDALGGRIELRITPGEIGQPA